MRAMGADGARRCAPHGRLWRGPAFTYTRQQTVANDLRPVASVMTWQGHRQVWGHRAENGGGCGTGVYLRVADGTFRGYAPGAAPSPTPERSAPGGR